MSQPACFSAEQAAELVSHFYARTAAPDLPLMDAATGECSRLQYQKALSQRHGAVIGYKVGLTNAAIRRAFRADTPQWGTLYEGMLLPNGSAVSASFGAQPTVEADLLVRVGSAEINTAQTIDDVLKALDQVIPFIELPDMLVKTPLKLNAHSLGAINLAARLGVMGVPVAVPQEPEQRASLQESLVKMKLVMADGAGVTLGESVGSDLLDHPLNAALWLVRELNRQGIRVQPGQFLSLGTFPPVRPPKAGTRFVVDYKGLEGSAPVWVQFRQ
ncbi:MAG: fumarylacetoacetate hydrolase [Pseudomonadota bacterium]|nr:fumarylacetoacetate hydrolase [Pseudomonadota bacterium]